MSVQPTFDSKCDLVLERIVDVPRHLVWAAWTKAEHLKHWYCPRPWTVSKCEIDLQPGGVFHTTLRSPEGDEFPYTGCYLEIVPEQRLVWTLTMYPGFRPAPRHEFANFTAIMTLESLGNSTRYVATVMHSDESSRNKHQSMGFHDGWGIVVTQMVEYVKSNLQS